MSQTDKPGSVQLTLIIEVQYDVPFVLIRNQQTEMGSKWWNAN